MSTSNPHEIKKLRQHAIDIFSAGLNQVKADNCILRNCRLSGSILTADDTRFDLADIDRVRVIGAGKATANMAAALEKILGDRISDGCIIVKYAHGVPLEKIRTIEAGHPLPDQNGVNGAAEIMSIAESSTETDLLVCLLSGGGSALLALPSPPVSLADKQETINVLMACGAEIDEINAIRKHISSVKGGQLARASYPAALLTLSLSDVVGDKLDVIASGPTVPDSSTFHDCLEIIDRFGISGKLPSSIMERLKKGAAGHLAETPKTGDIVFYNTVSHIIGSNASALNASRRHAESLGYNSIILSSMIQGDTRAAARLHSAITREIRKSGNPVPPPACILSGGETTVRITGNGKGGRNQEFALAYALDIPDIENTVLLSAGTDGTDGPTEAAGAVVDSDSIAKANRLSLDAGEFLRNNDSYSFFSRTDELLITGPTGTNVMDMRIMLVR